MSSTAKRGMATAVFIRGLMIAVLVVLAGLIYLWYASTHPLSNPDYGFQYYEPTQLPAGFHITEKRIDIIRPPGSGLVGIDAELNLRTHHDWVYIISESKATQDEALTTFTELNNYDPNSVAATCKQMHSPKGQSYRLCHATAYKTLSVYQVNFIRNGTFITTSFPGKVGKTIPLDQLQTYVDSFQKAHASGFKIVDGGI